MAFYRYVPHPWITIGVSPHDANLYAFVTNLFLLQGLHTNPILTWNHPSWSISAEFATYIVFALIWRSMRSKSWIASAGIVVAAPVLLFRLKGNMDVTFDWSILRALLGFALGAAVFQFTQLESITAAFGNFDKRIVNAIEFASAAMVIVFVMLAGLSRVSIVAPFVFAIVVLVFSFGRGALSGVLSSSPGRALGRLSYSIYMLHYPLQQLMMLFAVWLQTEAGFTGLFLVPDPASGRRPVLGATAWAGDVINVVMLLVLIGASALTYSAIESPWRARFRALATRS